MSQPDQRRILATSIPGPKSQKLQVQRAAELSSGVGVTHACLHRASWWRHPGRCRRQSHHRLRVRDRCDERRCVRPRRGRGVLRSRPSASPTRASWSRSTRERRRGRRAQPADPGRPPEADGVVHDRCGGGRERDQDRSYGDRSPGGDRARPRLPRTHAAHDDHDGEERAVQAGFRSIRSGGLPRSLAVPLPMAEWPRELRRRGAGGHYARR